MEPTLPKLAELEGQNQPRMEPVKEVGGTNDGEESGNIRILINDNRGTKMFVLVINSCSVLVKLNWGMGGYVELFSILTQNVSS